MRAVRVEHEGRTHAGLEKDGEVRLVPEPGIEPVSLVVEHGWEEFDRRSTLRVSLDAVRLLAPVSRPQKILCVGLNYWDHATEQGLETPDHPIIFAKMPSAIIGPREPIPLHPITSQTDYEAELGVVIGQRTRGLDAARALDVVCGYTPVNDVSARDLQFSDGQWVRAKSLDGFAPMGPALVSPEEIDDPGNLDITCHVNGELRQKSNTRNLIFDIPALISFCAEAMTLEPGDVICTGTPAGVGVFMEPPTFLQPGDVVTVDVERVGQLSNPVVEA